MVLGKTIVLLTELEFYDGSSASSTTSTSKIDKKKETKKESASDKDIVNKLKDLKELFETGALTKEQFEKAKEKLSENRLITFIYQPDLLVF